MTVSGHDSRGWVHVPSGEVWSRGHAVWVGWCWTGWSSHPCDPVPVRFIPIQGRADQRPCEPRQHCVIAGLQPPGANSHPAPSAATTGHQRYRANGSSSPGCSCCPLMVPIDPVVVHSRRTRACPLDQGSKSRSQIRIAATWRPRETVGERLFDRLLPVMAPSNCRSTGPSRASTDLQRSASVPGARERCRVTPVGATPSPRRWHHKQSAPGLTEPGATDRTNVLPRFLSVSSTRPGTPEATASRKVARSGIDRSAGASPGHRAVGLSSKRPFPRARSNRAADNHPATRSALRTSSHTNSDQPCSEKCL
jgi:hypothetical protein